MTKKEQPKKSLAVRIHRQGYSDIIGLLLCEVSEETHWDRPIVGVCNDFKMKPYEGMSFDEIKPTVILSKQAAQRLLNDLWYAGVRPEGYVDFERKYLEALERLTSKGA